MTPQALTAKPTAAERAGDWVAEAIACGMDPYFVQQPLGRVNPGKFHLGIYEVSPAPHPAPLSKELFGEAFTILERMGRVIRTGNQITT